MKIARAFAEIIRDEPVVRELWVSENTEEPGVHLWLIVGPIGLDEIGMLYERPLGQLYERFPRGDFMLHVVNPRHTLGDVHQVLRPDAERIPLRAD